MHITSGLSPASGEMLDGSTVLHLYDEVQCGTSYLGDDYCQVPESSHTVEIEYICEQNDYPNTVYSETEYAVRSIIEEASNFEDEQQGSDVAVERTRQQESRLPEPMAVEEPDRIDSDLTNLTWLQNITNIMAVPTFPLPPMSPSPQNKTPPQNTRLQKFNKTIEKCQDDFIKNKEEYTRNALKKPPYSYSTLICMAMRYNDNKMTLSAIYSWIRENFKYYRNADPTWQNSIRHNLSLNKMFVKVARSKQEPGKGGFWKLDLTRLDDNKRVSSSKPHKKKKVGERTSTATTDEPQKTVQADNEASALIQESNELVINKYYSSGTLHMNNIGANVIVEPAIPPPLMAEDDLNSLLLNPTEWDDLQLDMLDSFLDSCFK